MFKLISIAGVIVLLSACSGMSGSSMPRSDGMSGGSSMGTSGTMQGGSGAARKNGDGPN